MRSGATSVGSMKPFVAARLMHIVPGSLAMPSKSLYMFRSS